jgi:hypothetical protein
MTRYVSPVSHCPPLTIDHGIGYRCLNPCHAGGRRCIFLRQLKSQIVVSLLCCLPCSRSIVQNVQEVKLILQATSYIATLFFYNHLNPRFSFVRCYNKPAIRIFCHVNIWELIETWGIDSIMINIQVRCAVAAWVSYARAHWEPY